LKISFEIRKDYIRFKIRGFNYYLGTFERFNLSEYWVDICRDSGYIKTAILGLERKMDKFSETVINNRGFEFRLFTDEKEAVNWLNTS
jgi:hypothetical protein